jgi:predicted enzyme related to lactoylglutathione lyase
MLASGGNSGTSGGAGTIYLKDNAKAKADLIINNGGITTSNTTSIPGGDYGYVEVKGGAVLTVSGSYTTESDMVLTDTQLTVNGSLVLPKNLTLTNSTVNISGAVNVAGTLTLKNNSVLSHFGATTTAVYKLDITAPAVSIDATSKIDVSGRGYLGAWQGGITTDTGRTLGNVDGSTIQAGGSYGGLGGVSYYYGSGVNTLYGILQQPAELGSGGGGNGSGWVGGNGGGFVKLTTGSLLLDGSILADGGNAGAAGGGSGGGLMLTVGNLSGTGTIAARGGAATYSSNYASGGGGRIAVYYDTNTLPLANILATGGKSNNGSNPTTNGGAGTIYLKDNARTKADVIINNGGIVTNRSTTVPGGDYRIYDVIGGALASVTGLITSENEIVIKDTQVIINGDYAVPRNLTLQNGTLTVSGTVTAPGNLLLTNSRLSLRNNLNVTGTITAQSGSVLTHEAATSLAQYGLDIKAAGVVIDATSRIDVKGKGYLGGLQGDNGSDGGRGDGNSATGGGAGNGGSLGGSGGVIDGASAVAYGSIVNPAELGGGGGGNIVTPVAGGNGGGYVRLSAPALTLNGTISADGMDSASGAGSGGSIRLDVPVITGNGSILARGGNGGAAGGGGRIALYFTSNSILTANINASGGKGGDGSIITRNGGAGAVYLKQSAKAYADLVVDNHGLDSAVGSTTVKTAGKGIITVITGSSLMQGSATWGASALKGYWVKPNIGQAAFFKILDNSADTIFINPADGNLNSVAAVGDSFSGVFALNSLTVLGKAHLVSDEQFNVTGDATIDDADVVAGELIAARTLLTNGGLFTRSAVSAP